MPELDFEFANIFLLTTAPDGRLAVQTAAGATTSANIESMPAGQPDAAGRSYRIPTWAAPGQRVLDPHDILVYVATRRRAVVVAARDMPEDDHVIVGYPEDLLTRKQVPILRNDGSSAGFVRAVRLHEAADRGRLSSEGDESTTYRVTDDFTLNAELFDAYGHAQLVRVFVPFGSDAAGGRATGVLEAGFHISRCGRLERVQIEALRACVPLVAAVHEIAGEYETVARRADQLDRVNDVGNSLAGDLDPDQVLARIAGHFPRAIDTSVCLIALLEEDGSAWYGAASSDLQELWKQRRVERPTASIVFDVADQGRPMVVEDAQHHDLVSPYIARLLGIRSLLALPLIEGDRVLGTIILGERDRTRSYTTEEVERAWQLARHAAAVIHNAQLYARTEDVHHFERAVILVGFGESGQKAYEHLLLLRNLFGFRVHVIEEDVPGRREELVKEVRRVRRNGDLFYWSSLQVPAYDQLAADLDPNCHVATYISTTVNDHLEMLKIFYDLSSVVLIERPFGASPLAYHQFLDVADRLGQIVAAEHYWFKPEVELLEQLRVAAGHHIHTFLDEMDEIEIEILTEESLPGQEVQAGVISEFLPDAFAILSLIVPIDEIVFDVSQPLLVGRSQPVREGPETFAQLNGTFERGGRNVRLTISVGRETVNEKFIKLGAPQTKGRGRPFFKIDIDRGVVVDGTQTGMRAAVRPIRRPSIQDSARLNMFRHVLEKKNPAFGVLAIRGAVRRWQRVRELEEMAAELLARGEWTPYERGQRPVFDYFYRPVVRSGIDSESSPRSW